MSTHPETRFHLLRFRSEVAPSYSVQCVFGVHTWSIMARPGPAYGVEIYGWDAWALLLIGLLSVVVFLLYTYTRRRADKMLRQSESQYRLVSENTADVIWIFDLESQHFGVLFLA